MTGIATTKKFIKTPEDFKGIRMRALDKKQAKWLEIWGANSVIIPWAEIYNSLQTGIADGYMNPAFVPVMFKHNEVLKYYSAANLAPSLRVSICSEDWYRGLSDKDRAVVDEGVKQADGAVKKWTEATEETALEGLRKAGMEVYINTPEDKAKFAKAIKAEYDNIVAPEIVKVFVEAADKNR